MAGCCGCAETPLTDVLDEGREDSVVLDGTPCPSYAVPMDVEVIESSALDVRDIRLEW